MRDELVKLPSGQIIKRRPKVSALDIGEYDLAVFPPHLPDYYEPIRDIERSSGQSRYDTKDFDVSRLQSCQLAVYGAGAVGGYVAYLLSPARPILRTYPNNPEQRNVIMAQTR
jgi:hypothetical protein